MNDAPGREGTAQRLRELADALEAGTIDGLGYFAVQDDGGIWQGSGWFGEVNILPSPCSRMSVACMYLMTRVGAKMFAEAEEHPSFIQ